MIQISAFTGICILIAFLALGIYCLYLANKNHSLEVQDNLRLAYQKNQKRPTSKELDDALLALQKAYTHIELMRVPNRDLFLQIIKTLWNYLPEGLGTNTKVALHKSEYEVLMSLKDNLAEIHYNISDPSLQSSSIYRGLDEVNRILLFLHDYLNRRYINNAEPFTLPVDEQDTNTKDIIRDWIDSDKRIPGLGC